MSGDACTLVVIDMQAAFRDRESQWCVPRYAEAEANVRRLVERSAGPVVWTRFVRDPEEKGAWSDYYARWHELRVSPQAKEWDLTSPARDADDVLDLPTFSKWGPELDALSAAVPRLAICGVATDCCVLGTVLGAVDAGRPVTVITDACAGVTDTAHQQALGLMELLSPMVTLADTERFIGEGQEAARTG